MTKPGFILKRIKLLFQSADLVEQEKVFDAYIKNRDKQIEKSCYCGHTTTCDCGNLTIAEFKESLLNDKIKEKDL